MTDKIDKIDKISEGQEAYYYRPDQIKILIADIDNFIKTNKPINIYTNTNKDINITPLELKTILETIDISTSRSRSRSKSKSKSRSTSTSVGFRVSNEIPSSILFDTMKSPYIKDYTTYSKLPNGIYYIVIHLETRIKNKFREKIFGNDIVITFHTDCSNSGYNYLYKTSAIIYNQQSIHKNTENTEHTITTITKNFGYIKKSIDILHANKLWHGDIKLQNTVICDDKMKLIDFPNYSENYIQIFDEDIDICKQFWGTFLHILGGITFVFNCDTIMVKPQTYDHICFNLMLAHELVIRKLFQNIKFDDMTKIYSELSYDDANTIFKGNKLSLITNIDLELDVINKIFVQIDTLIHNSIIIEEPVKDYGFINNFLLSNSQQNALLNAPKNLLQNAQQNSLLNAPKKIYKPTERNTSKMTNTKRKLNFTSNSKVPSFAENNIKSIAIILSENIRFYIDKNTNNTTEYDAYILSLREIEYIFALNYIYQYLNLHLNLDK